MGKPSVLVVDDDHNVREVVCRVVEQCGCTAIESHDYDQALELAAKHHIDAAITDWDLKKTRTGVDIARKLQRENPDLPLVFITGMSVCGLSAASKDITVYRIMEKPVSLAELRVVIQELVGVDGSY